MAVIFGTSFLLMLLMVWALNFVINSHKPEDVSLFKGLHYGVFTGFFFAMQWGSITFTSAAALFSG
jgi:hypothetical protein